METKRKTTTGPIVVKLDSRLNKINTEGAFQVKIDKMNEILKKAPLPVIPKEEE